MCGKHAFTEANHSYLALVIPAIGDICISSTRYMFIHSWERRSVSIEISLTNDIQVERCLKKTTGYWLLVPSSHSKSVKTGYWPVSRQKLANKRFLPSWIYQAVTNQ